jgi:hypothetical protein
MRQVLLLAVLASLVSLPLWGAIWLGHPLVANENQVIEYMQVAFLVGGFLLFHYAFIKNRVNAYGTLYFSLSIFYLTFLARELEPENPSTIFAMIVNPPVRNYWLAIAWSIALVLFLRNVKAVLLAFRDWIKQKHGASIMVAGAFYLLADLFDKKVFAIGRETNLLLEESLEFNGTIFMALSAALSLVWSTRQRWWGERR